MTTPNPFRYTEGGAIDREALEAYLREDLAELDNPNRQDRRVLLTDLRFLFRAYYHNEKRPDRVPVEG